MKTSTSPKLNLNVQTDEHGVNDFLFCWSELGERPNKLIIYNQYEPDGFLKYVEGLKLSNQGSFTEVAPTEVDYIVNEKSLVLIYKSIFLSYTHYDKENESTFVGDLNFYYLEESENKLNEIIKEIQPFIINSSDGDIDEIESESKIFDLLSVGQSGLELNPIKPLTGDYDNIELYHNDSTFKKVKKLIKNLDKTKKGLTIICGERGTGKTTLVSYIGTEIEKPVIFVPSNLIETTINTGDFMKFLKANKNQVVVIDDCELYFDETYSKANVFTNNLLQLVDGFQSDSLDVNIIIILNIEDINRIDHALLECNNLVEIIELNPLKRDKANELSQFLDKKAKFKVETKLVDVLKKRISPIIDNEIGF